MQGHKEEGGRQGCMRKPQAQAKTGVRTPIEEKERAKDSRN